MATFRSAISRWMVAAAVTCGSLVFMGAAFAPFNPSLQLSPDRGPSLEAKVVSGSLEAILSPHRDAALLHLGELILAHRAISTSA